MRIASLAPSVTEILFELGAGQQIVCSTIFCDYPEPAKQLPKVGSWVNIDQKKLLDLKPDIVFTSSAVQGILTTQLKALGLRVVNVNPMRLTEVVESYNYIGALTGREPQAGKIAGTFYKKIMGYHLLPGRSPSPRVYCEEWSDPPMAAGNWVPDIVQLAGGTAGIGEAGKLSRKFELEEILRFNPEIIILHLCGMGEKVDPAQVKTRPGWENLKAVQNGRVHVLDDSLLNRPTSRLLQGLEKLKQIINV